MGILKLNVKNAPEMSIIFGSQLLHVTYVVMHVKLSLFNV